MTPRGTDWSLALLVAAGVASGLATWFAGSPGAGWVFAAHAVAGGCLAAVVVVKLRRVLPRVAPASVAALTLVVVVLGSGWCGPSAGSTYLAGYSVLAWHAALGGALAAIVFTHALARAKRPRRRDLANRRQFLLAGAAGAGALGPGRCSGRSSARSGCRAPSGASPAATTPARSPATTSRPRHGSPTTRPRRPTASPSPAGCAASSRWRPPRSTAATS